LVISSALAGKKAFYISAKSDIKDAIFAINAVVMVAARIHDSNVFRPQLELEGPDGTG